MLRLAAQDSAPTARRSPTSGSRRQPETTETADFAKSEPASSPRRRTPPTNQALTAPAPQRSDGPRCNSLAAGWFHGADAFCRQSRRAHTNPVPAHALAARQLKTRRNRAHGRSAESGHGWLAAICAGARWGSDVRRFVHRTLASTGGLGDLCRQDGSRGTGRIWNNQYPCRPGSG